MRAVRILLALAVLTAAAWFLPGTVGGRASYLITHGISMEPGFQAGDLAIVRQSRDYRVGDVVAYHSEQMKTVVMHRVVSIEGDRYSFKGDNNDFIDVDHPTAEEFLGRLAVRVPHGGTLLQWLGSPLGLAVTTFALLGTGGGAVVTGRRRRYKRRKEAAMSRPTTAHRARFLAVSSLPPSLRTTAAIALVLGIFGSALGTLVWTGPVDEPSTSQVKSGTRMDFSYTAAVGQSAAYDGTTADSPDPVFRKLANTVDVHFTYSGEPGTVAVTADLSTPGGWHSEVPLSGPVTFTGNEYQGSVRLDLSALEARAQAASAVTGLPSGPVSIALAPQVRTAAGADFRPELQLNLTPLQLSLAGAPDTLSVTDSSTTQQTVMAPRMVGVKGAGINAATARIVAAALLLAALAAGAITVIMARRVAPVDEGTAIRRRYAALLVRVHPMPAPQGRPVIDVTTFPTLAKLAERYGLLVLHWTRSDVETFIVQDESTTYRYRAGADAASGELQPDLADVFPDEAADRATLQ